ncbi:50S ribosomal protein L18 [Candidatus Woesearchaeota archaeon]|nr:50S ribosomal protein L18P [uncultured archaeon]MBS3141448.1 50S ribosomal protein L18 [Candidatus Woesearchaeota archaeon]
MAKNKRSNIPYKRRRKARTDYKQRLKLLKSQLPRLVVRRKLNSFIVQLIEFKDGQDYIKNTATRKELLALGWKYNTGNLPSAYLYGLVIGSKNKGKPALLDLGLQKSIKGSSIYAVVKGAVDAGMKINVSKEVLPSEERISGKHIVEYSKKLKSQQKEYEKQFGKYIKTNVNPENIESQFKEIKAKILKK